jgi:tRNA threonylcarbamoyladenosine biosynthesis protein TsaB
MALILSIDTGTELAGICLTRDDHSLGILRNDDQKDHAAWLHPAIKQLIENAGFGLQELSAVACNAGPGSYTGLRVGMATAKGLCYTLNIPFITENSLRIMSLAAQQQPFPKADFFICPMIDARRLEVFTALYDRDLKEVIPPTAIILGENSFSAQLNEKAVLFLGSGIIKWKSICGHPNAYWLDQPFLASHLAGIAYQKFLDGQFSGLHSTEPFYLKEFYTHKKK